MSGLLQAVSTRDALVSKLREQILNGELRPGDSLTETAVAATFGVARPTVRSALQVLVSRNLVQDLGRRSLIVPVLGLTDVDDLFYVRTPLEMQCVRTIVKSKLPLHEAELRLADLANLSDDATWADRVEIHSALHTAIIGAVGSSRLGRIYATLQDEIQLCLAQLQPWYPRPQDLAEEHRRLLDAISSGSLRRAETEMREHLTRAVSNFSVVGSAAGKVNF